MPKSKTRKPSRPVQDKPVRPVTGVQALETAALALVQASLEVVREAELHITAAARAGDEEGVQKALSVHHSLRSGRLGLLIAYSELAGLPDPRESRVVATD